MKSTKKKIVLSLVLCITMLCTTILMSAATGIKALAATSGNIIVHFYSQNWSSPNKIGRASCRERV